MYKERIMNVTVKDILDTRYPRKNGTYPIRIEVIFNRVQKYYNTGKDISTSDWGNLFSSRQQHLIKIKAAVKKSFEFVLENVEDLVYNDFFSFDNLLIRLGRISAGTISSLFRNKIETLKKSGHIGTMDYYVETLRCIEKYEGTEIPVENITVEWLKRYEQYLRASGKGYATISMHMRGIRTIMNEAKARKLIKESRYPFGKKKFEIKEYKAEPKTLTLEQICLIADYNSASEITNMYRDIWLFIFLCNGINPADLVNLKFRDIVNGEISFIREKTKNTSTQIKPIKVVVTHEMQAIIDHWGNKSLPDNYIFPVIKHYKDLRKHKTQVGGFVKRINKHMNKIGKSLSFGRITTYTARHSFATILKQKGVNLLYIAEALGHSDIKSTSSYLNSFKKEERMKNALILTQYKNC